MIETAPLHGPHFENGQWTVDLAGIENNLSGYFISLDRVNATTARLDGVFYGPPIHIAESHGSFDIDLFIHAFEYALRLRVRLAGQVVDEAMLRATIQHARTIAEKSRALAEIRSRRHKTEADRYRPMLLSEWERWENEAEAIYQRERR